MKISQKLAAPAAALLAAAALNGSAFAAVLPENGTRLQDQSAQSAVLTASEQTGTQEDWRLLLVNSWNELPEDYQVELRTLANGLQVDERIYDDLNDMLTDCREAGLEPIVCSAYRTGGYADPALPEQDLPSAGGRLEPGGGKGGGGPLGGASGNQ